MSLDEKYRDNLIKLSRRLADRGQLIESGWTGFRALVIPPSAPQLQVDEMKKAFYAGAHHFFAAVMSVMDDGDEPSDADLARMQNAAAELRSFAATFERRYGSVGRS